MHHVQNSSFIFIKSDERHIFNFVRLTESQGYFRAHKIQSLSPIWSPFFQALKEMIRFFVSHE